MQKMGVGTLLLQYGQRYSSVYFLLVPRAFSTGYFTAFRIIFCICHRDDINVQLVAYPNQIQQHVGHFRLHRIECVRRQLPTLLLGQPLKMFKPFGRFHRKRRTDSWASGIDPSRTRRRRLLGITQFFQIGNDDDSADKLTNTSTGGRFRALLPGKCRQMAIYVLLYSMEKQIRHKNRRHDSGEIREQSVGNCVACFLDADRTEI